MIYDITTIDAAYNTIKRLLNIQPRDLRNYLNDKKDKDFSDFIEKYNAKIEQINLQNLKLVVMHITSSIDDCVDIRKYGIKNLQWVLSNETKLSKFLEKEGIIFDINQGKMFVNDKEYNIKYEQYEEIEYSLTELEEKVEDISYKIYCDYQINGLFCVNSRFNYGTTDIRKHPEFLEALSKILEQEKLVSKWERYSKGYVIYFEAKVSELEYYSFGAEVSDDEDYLEIKEYLVYMALERCVEEDLERYVYMKPNIGVLKNNIKEIIEIKENK